VLPECRVCRPWELVETHLHETHPLHLRACHPDAAAELLDVFGRKACPGDLVAIDVMPGHGVACRLEHESAAVQQCRHHDAEAVRPAQRPGDETAVGLAQPEVLCVAPRRRHDLFGRERHELWRASPPSSAHHHRRSATESRLLAAVGAWVARRSRSAGLVGLESPPPQAEVAQLKRIRAIECQVREAQRGAGPEEFGARLLRVKRSNWDPSCQCGHDLTAELCTRRGHDTD
jgi:hypothetical protein